MMTKVPLYKKAIWIAEQMGDPESVEDYYDILLGNIKEPQTLVNSVFEACKNYDAILESNQQKITQSFLQT